MTQHIYSASLDEVVHSRGLLLYEGSSKATKAGHGPQLC